jgi:hypothetical protein
MQYPAIWHSEFDPICLNQILAAAAKFTAVNPQIWAS